MTNRVHANNYITTLNGSITDVATSIVVSSTTGFPTIGSGAVCHLTLQNGSNIEIVQATARSGTTVTVVRAQEGTTGLAFVSGSTVSIRPTANSVDRKQDLDSYTTTATAAGTTTLTVNSTIDQYFTGVTTQTVVLPVTSTLALGRPFRVVNESSGVVTVQSSGANSIQAMAANTILDLECILTSGTGTASWYANYRAKTNPGTAGDVVGPGSATDDAVARYDATTGKIIQNSGVIIDDSNNVTGALSLAATSYLKAGGNASAAGYIELLEDSDNGTNKVTVTAPAALGADRTATFPDASGTFLLTGNAINSVPSITFSSTSGVIGTTTNDSAAAGSVGEIISSVVEYGGSPVSISNATSTDLTSISLTAGSWDIWGNLEFSPTIGVTRGLAWINTTSATPPDNAYYTDLDFSPAVLGALGQIAPGITLKLSGTTTVYISGKTFFASGTCVFVGGIYARRRR